jgi:beta propeller repeat protein
MRTLIQRPYKKRFFCAVLFGVVLGASGCGDKSPQAGEVADTDTKEKKDSESVKNSSDETDKDAGSGAPWAWTDNPESEDCGRGCTQLTFEDRVNEMQWDIWEDKLVYADGWWRIFVVDISDKKTLQIPDVYPEYPSSRSASSKVTNAYPAIFQNTIFYSLGVGDTPHRHEIVRVDLASSAQQVIWQREDHGSEYFLPEELDVYKDCLVTSGSTGDPANRALGFHEPPWPSTGEVLIDRTYGGNNSVWGNTLVFWALDGMREDIRGYDFSTEKFFSVTNDDEYQYAPRIHNRRVVYMDLRLGESNTRGTWAHGAIFMKDLDLGEVLQITDGSALASYPDIYGDIIVWMDWRNCEYPNNKNDLSAIEIWGHNLKTGSSFQITNLPEYKKGFPRIWKDKVYVHMFKGAENGIYQFELPEKAM